MTLIPDSFHLNGSQIPALIWRLFRTFHRFIKELKMQPKFIQLHNIYYLTHLAFLTQ